MPTVRIPWNDGDELEVDFEIKSRAEAPSLNYQGHDVELDIQRVTHDGLIIDDYDQEEIVDLVLEHYTDEEADN